MANHLFGVVGDGNIVGNNLANVGNRITNYNIHAHHERKILTLESSVSFGALLKSGERYPAPKCHPATRKAAQKVVKNWFCWKGEGSEKGIMWMSGAPGVGKSAITQTVCEELCADDGSTSWLSKIIYRQRYIDGCFFFTRGFENRENASFFPATIAFQLRRSRPSCCTAIDKAIEKRPEILSEDFASQFRQLLMKAAQEAGFLQGPVTVVIDGLDECNSAPDQVRLLELMLEAVKTGNMRFFIASRPEEQIHNFFHRPGVAQHTYHVRLDEETFQTSHDIKTFLREEFARIRRENPYSCHRLPNGEDWPGERVLDHLTVESDSQFMFPTLAVSFIDTPYFPPERQLQILLESPPLGAFSALDNLYHKILSRQPPAHLLRGEEDLCEYQGVVMGILRVIIAWSGKPLSAADIAVVLDKPSDTVHRIVRGPMRTLFKFHTSNPDSPISLCHKSLRDYLLARNRSREFYIPSPKGDDLFIALLSRPPAVHPSHPHLQGLVMDVLSFLSATCHHNSIAHTKQSVLTTAEFLDVDSVCVDYIVNKGPTRLLFNLGRGLVEGDAQGKGEDNEDNLTLCTSSFERFLQDRSRSGPFFLDNRRTDTLFIRALSRPPPSGSPYSLTRDIMLDILATLPAPHHPPVAIDHISSFLELDPGLVEYAVTLGPVKWLVSTDEHHRIRPISWWVNPFLEDGDRSKVFFVSPRRLDPFIIRLLSKQSPSESTPHNVLKDVLTATPTFQEESTIDDVAFLLGISRTLVEGVVKLEPTNLLFRVNQDKVSFFHDSLFWFFHDFSRSGSFFISNNRVDTFLTNSLSRGSLLGSSSLYSRDNLLDILAVVLDLRNILFMQLSVCQIATFFDVDATLVEHVVKFGAEKWMFNEYDSGILFVTRYNLSNFLQDPGRSGHFFISDRRLDPFFVKTLSRLSPNFDPLQSKVSSHEIIHRVLAATLVFDWSLTIEGTASLIGADPVFVEEVVGLEAMKTLLAVDGAKIAVRLPSLRGFLQDSTRSGPFFVSQSDIDALFIHILSNAATPLRGVRPHSQELLMDILSILIICDPIGPTVRCVAAFLDIDSIFVGGVVSGPTKQLFLLGRNGQIRLSTKMLRPFLRDVDRARNFCITEARMADIFTRFLSRELPPHPPLSRTQHILQSVLMVMVNSHRWPSIARRTVWTVDLLSAFLDVDPTAIIDVIDGTSRVLFNPRSLSSEVEEMYFPSQLRHFLKDAKRSGRFFVSDKSLDPYFSRILSSPLPSAGSNSRSQDVLKDILTLILVARDGWPTVTNIAAALDVNASIIDNIVMARPIRLLFDVSWTKDSLRFSTTSLAKFLRDADRSGEFCITDAMMDALFIRILSHPAPSHFATPPSKDDILRVMAVVMASPEPVAVPRIAALLGIDRIVVEGVVEIMPTNVLFEKDRYNLDKLGFSGPFLKPFLYDSHRSGEFYISPTITLDDIPKLWPQHPVNLPEVFGDEEMEDQESAKGDSARQSETCAGMDMPFEGPIQPLAAFTLPKRKFSRLTSSRQGSLGSANEVAASPSTPLRTKRPKTRGSLMLDSDNPQDLVGLDPDSGDEEAMIAEAMLVDDEETWATEAAGDGDVSMEEGER